MLKPRDGDAAAGIDVVGEAEEVVLLGKYDFDEVVFWNDVLEIEKDNEIDEMNEGEFGEGEAEGCFVSPIPGDESWNGGEKDIDFVDKNKDG